MPKGAAQSQQFSCLGLTVFVMVVLLLMAFAVQLIDRAVHPNIRYSSNSEEPPVDMTPPKEFVSAQRFYDNPTITPVYGHEVLPLIGVRGRVVQVDEPQIAMRIDLDAGGGRKLGALFDPDDFTRVPHRAPVGSVVSLGCEKGLMETHSPSLDGQEDFEEPYVAGCHLE